MGATFKENVSDIRNSKVADVIKELKSFLVNVEITDPFAKTDELSALYGFELTEKISDDYDAVLVAVPHEVYKNLDDDYFSSITKPSAMIADIKGIFRGKIYNRHYWSL
jgi:UDP-N-acetyl-D-galactosamine dehydrogenase